LFRQQQLPLKHSIRNRDSQTTGAEIFERPVNYRVRIPDERALASRRRAAD